MSAESAATSKEAESSPAQPKLSAAQRARAERNRQKALLLRQARLAKRPARLNDVYEKLEGSEAARKRVRDTGGGFLLEEEDEADSGPPRKRKIVEDVPPPGCATSLDPFAQEEKPCCEECRKDFSESYLLTHFDLRVCNDCRDRDGKHSLITKTDAKNEFLLKDCDLDSRTPILRFILKKNPHSSRGEMKLYLRCQIENRAMEVWGSEEKLEEAKEQRAENRTNRKLKAYDKKMKALRMAVRSSLYKKDVGSHEHEFGPETQNDDDEDIYERVCKSCGYVQQYEKM